MNDCLDQLCDRAGIAGLVLTGGNDFAERRKLPVLGAAAVCSSADVNLFRQIFGSNK
jgi:hypothetical protein